MYTLYVIYKSFPGKREEFITRAKEAGVVDAVRNEEGCIRYDYYFSEKDENELLLVEAWESRNHQQIHLTQPHIANLKAIKEECIESTVISEFESKKYEA